MWNGEQKEPRKDHNKEERPQQKLEIISYLWIGKQIESKVTLQRS